jgi:four helix bundle protein
MMPQKENIIKTKTEAYSTRIIKLYQYLQEKKHELVISKQILRSGTSIGANTAESRNAQSTPDFIHKLSIALKEADETSYWLKSLYGGEYLTRKQFDSMFDDNEEIIKLLTSIIKTMKEKIKEDGS